MYSPELCSRIPTRTHTSTHNHHAYPRSGLRLRSHSCTSTVASPPPAVALAHSPTHSPTPPATTNLTPKKTLKKGMSDPARPIILLPSPPASPIPFHAHHHAPQQQQRRKRAAYSSSRVIPSLRRHETMLFGDALNPVACQSQDNYSSAFQGMLDESSDEERRRGSQSSCSSAGTSQASVSS